MDTQLLHTCKPDAKPEPVAFITVDSAVNRESFTGIPVDQAVRQRLYDEVDRFLDKSIRLRSGESFVITIE